MPSWPAGIETIKELIAADNLEKGHTVTGGRARGLVIADEGLCVQSGRCGCRRLDWQAGAPGR